MKTVDVFLPSAAHVQMFVDALAPLSGDFELISDNYILDARSMMGIFGFNLAKPVKLRIYNDSAENLSVLAPFIVEEMEKYE